MNPIAFTISFVVLFFLSMIGITSCHKVPTGNVGVVTVFGKVEKNVLTEGLHFLNPIARVHDIDCRQDVYTIDNISFPSQDQLISNADISVKWRIDGVHAPDIFQNTGDREAVVVRHIEPKIRSLIRETSRSVKTAEEFFNNEVQQKIQLEMTEELTKYMTPYGVLIDEVMVRDVILPQVIQDGVVAKKLREQKAQEQEAELMRYKTEQQQQVEKAKADKEAAEMEAEKTKIAADAKAYAFETEAKAKAKALELEGTSIRNFPDVIKMRAIEGWNGELPKFFGGDVVPLLQFENILK